MRQAGELAGLTCDFYEVGFPCGVLLILTYDFYEVVQLIPFVLRFPKGYSIMEIHSASLLRRGGAVWLMGIRRNIARVVF